jgi:hypothetical protein
MPVVIRIVSGGAVGVALATAMITAQAPAIAKAGPEEEPRHCFGGARGMHVWAADALAFVDQYVHP